MSYKEKLARYKKMENWCKNAKVEEQEKFIKHIFQVIEECRQEYNKEKCK